MIFAYKCKDGFLKNIGEYDFTSNSFYKEIDKEKHLFKKLNAYGIDAEVFDRILKPNNATIKLYAPKGNTTYYATVKDFMEHGTYFHFENAKEDYAPQIFLPLDFFATQCMG
jgi:hypothetical protein